MANETTAGATTGPEAGLPETAKQQVSAIVPELPFEDDPSTFVRVMVELAEAHALDDGE
jgi:hypothetical protein